MHICYLTNSWVHESEKYQKVTFSIFLVFIKKFPPGDTSQSQSIFCFFSQYNPPKSVLFPLASLLISANNKLQGRAFHVCLPLYRICISLSTIAAIAWKTLGSHLSETALKNLDQLSLLKLHFTRSSLSNPAIFFPLFTPQITLLIGL